MQISEAQLSLGPRVDAPLHHDVEREKFRKRWACACSKLRVTCCRLMNNKQSAWLPATHSYPSTESQYTYYFSWKPIECRPNSLQYYLPNEVFRGCFQQPYVYNVPVFFLTIKVKLSDRFLHCSMESSLRDAVGTIILISFHVTTGVLVFSWLLKVQLPLLQKYFVTRYGDKVVGGQSVKLYGVGRYFKTLQHTHYGKKIKWTKSLRSLQNYGFV